MQMVGFLIEAEFLQPVGIGETPQSAKLLGPKAALKFIGYGHKCHARIITFGEAGAYNLARCKRRALAITETELNVIAALAITGLSSKPKTG